MANFKGTCHLVMMSKRKIRVNILCRMYCQIYLIWNLVFCNSLIFKSILSLADGSNMFNQSFNRIFQDLTFAALSTNHDWENIWFWNIYAHHKQAVIHDLQLNHQVLLINYTEHITIVTDSPVDALCPSECLLCKVFSAKMLWN